MGHNLEMEIFKHFLKKNDEIVKVKSPQNFWQTNLPPHLQIGGAMLTKQMETGFSNFQLPKYHKRGMKMAMHRMIKNFKQKFI